MKPEVLKIAMGELGEKEIYGRKHNKRIVEYHQSTSGNFSNDETPWCSSFANWVAEQSGLPKSNNAMAKSWMKVGRKTSYPQPGDIVVLTRGRKNSPFGHVAFFLGYTADGQVYCLGGNQRNEVNITAYSKSKVVGFRRLSKSSNGKATTGLPVGYLRKGDSSSNVKLLQQALIKLKYLDDNADGIFGPKTETALKRFQKVEKITVDGIYGSESRVALKERLK